VKALPKRTVALLKPKLPQNVDVTASIIEEKHTSATPEEEGIILGYRD
jgi:hypothetical protein